MVFINNGWWKSNHIPREFLLYNASLYNNIKLIKNLHITLQYIYTTFCMTKQMKVIRAFGQAT